MLNSVHKALFFLDGPEILALYPIVPCPLYYMCTRIVSLLLNQRPILSLNPMRADGEEISACQALGKRGRREVVATKGHHEGALQ